MNARTDFALRIADRAQYAELAVQRMLGADWLDAYHEAWRVMDEVYDLVLAPDRDVQFLGLRIINT